MARRPVATILEEWRVLEHLLHESMDTAERIDTERAVASLADEHREAMEAQQPTLDSFGVAPSLGLAEP